MNFAILDQENRIVGKVSTGLKGDFTQVPKWPGVGDAVGSCG